MEQYFINKGEHRSGWYFRPFINKTIMHGQFKFSDQCLYDRELTDQINKLGGFCFLHHHFQSIRIGWRPKRMDHDKPIERRTGHILIELFLYYYVGKERGWQWIRDVIPGKSFRFILRMEPNVLFATITTPTAMGLADSLYWDDKSRNVTLDFADKELQQDYSGSPYHPYTGYVLFPYFGGDKPAPWDMNIRFEYRLK